METVFIDSSGESVVMGELSKDSEDDKAKDAHSEDEFTDQKLTPDPPLGSPDVLFSADPTKRQYKIKPHSGKCEGNFGRPAQSGLPTKVRKPHKLDDKQWRQAKAQWLRMDAQER